MGQLFFGPDDEAPLSEPEGVIRFLGKGKVHWRENHSAYEAAYSWFEAQDLPASIRAIISADPAFADARLERAYFERLTDLDDLGRGPSHTDVLAILRLSSGATAVLGVEAKMNESFGQLVAEWNDYSPGKLRRLASLVERLRLRGRSIPALRYQLFHRTVATLIEAKKAGAREAALIVQSFSADHAGFDDFRAFAALLGTPVAEPGLLSPAVTLEGIRFRSGWTTNPFHSAGKV